MAISFKGARFPKVVILFAVFFYVRVKGKWVYLYRAVDKFGKTLDVMLSRRRNKAAATKFFAQFVSKHSNLLCRRLNQFSRRHETPFMGRHVLVVTKQNDRLYGLA